MIKWDETDVLACLEVEPKVDRDGVCYRYVANHGDLTLELLVIPGGDDVRVVLANATRQIIANVWMTGCREIRYARDEQGEKLIFVSHESSTYRPNIPSGMCLQIRPSFQLNIGNSTVPVLF